MTTGKITKRSVDAMRPGETLFDSLVKGFMVRAYATRKVYGLKYVAHGRQRIFTIGEHGAFTPDEALKKAKTLRGLIANGKDPHLERDDERNAARRDPTIAVVADRYLSEHVANHNKPSMAREAKRMVESKIKPGLGHLRLANLTRADVKKWHSDMRATPYEANRCLACLQKMLSLAVKEWELRDSNPCIGMTRYPEKKRERYFADDELKALGAALAAEESAGADKSALALVRFLALTGLRANEARTLRWSDVDLSRAAIRLNDAKAGARHVAIGAPVCALLANMDGSGDFVFPALTDEGPVFTSRVRRLWIRVRDAAGLANARPHDLRHTLGTYAAQTGANAFIVRDILGHRTLAMTGRYVERAIDPLRATADAASNRISAALGNLSGDVIPIKGARA